MNKRSKRISRKKAVPLYFQRSNSSSSQFLLIAQYKHRIKELKRVNKELACSLQEAKCRTAEQERLLSDFNRENTHMMLVKMKVKDLVETVQKLVTDVGEVHDVIDGKTFDFLKNCGASHQEARLQIRNPGFSTIEESGSISTIEADLSKEQCPSFDVPFFDADCSQTEIYNVPLILAAEQKLSNVSKRKKSSVTSRSSKSLEKINIATRSSKSLEKINIATRSSKSLERNDPAPTDQASPATPQTPVFLPNFPLSIKPFSLESINKVNPIASRTSVESQKSAYPSEKQLSPLQASVESQKPVELESVDPHKQQLSNTAFATKNTQKGMTSKIPVKKLASSENYHQPTTSSNHRNQRETYVIEEPRMHPPVSDQRGTYVLNSLTGKTETLALDTLTGDTKTSEVDTLSNNTFDRRGTFVLNPSTCNTKSDVDRRGTFVVNSLADNDKPDPTFDRRTTYFIPTKYGKQPGPSPKQTETHTPTQSEKEPSPSPPKRIENHIPSQSAKQPDPSPPKQIETHNPVQNVTNNHTILFCEDMELTEILPIQNDTGQFLTTMPPWIVKQETDESGSSEKSCNSVGNQYSCLKSPVNQLPGSNITPSKQIEASATEVVAQNAHIKNALSGGENLEKSSASEAKLMKDKEKSVKKKERNADTNYSSKELPSPISNLTKMDLSTQHKIFQSFATTSTISEKDRLASDALHVVEENDRKKSVISRRSLANIQPAVENAEAGGVENAESSKVRRSCRKHSKKVVVTFSDTDESDIDFDKDFTTDKRFSLKPGRKIINPNNKKVFVFKKNSTKESPSKDTLTDSCSYKSTGEDIKEEELGIFDFSASSEAGKSPVKKGKKRKSVMPKSTKRKSSSKKSAVDQMLIKRKSKKSFKSEVNSTEGSVFALPRKSILCLSKDNEPITLTPALTKRKSVRFSMAGNIPLSGQSNPNCNSPLLSNRKSVGFISEEASQDKKNNANCNVTVAPVNENSGDYDTHKEPSAPRNKSKKKNSSVQAIKDVRNPTSPKAEKSRKRLLCNLNLDSPEGVDEAECIPNKKLLQKANEIPQEIESVDKGVKEGSHGKSGNVSSSEGLGEKMVNLENAKNFHGILSELGVNLDSNGKVAESSNKTKKKRTFSGVSERRSSKKEPMIDDLFLDLDNAVSGNDEKELETAFTLADDELIKEETKNKKADRKKSGSVKAKEVKQKKSHVKKESTQKKKAGSELSKDKENTPNETENMKIDILTRDGGSGLLLKSKESTENIANNKKSKQQKVAAPLPQKEIKTDVLSSELPLESVDATSGRSKRNRPVKSFKEPKLNSKMRRE